MRTTLLTGLALLIGGVAVVLIGSGMELESTALLGVAIGAAVALVPDRAPAVRLGGFLAGFLAAWIGYFVRAALLPDTSGGRAVAVALVLVLCVGLAAVTLNRLPLWSTLLGAAALAGGYEATYAASPAEIVDTSVSAVTTLLITVAVGFLAAALVAPPAATSRPAGARRQDGADRTNLDSMMENAR